MSKQLKLAKEQRFQDLESTMMKGRKRDRMKVMRAIHATESSEPAAVGLAVFALAHDEEESVRQAAVGILTNVDTTDATQALAEAALSDDDDLTRYQCVWALGPRLGQPNVPNTLLTTIRNDSAGDVRTAAVRARQRREGPLDRGP
jgi:HEAT repeat protein